MRVWFWHSQSVVPHAIPVDDDIHNAVEAHQFMNLRFGNDSIPSWKLHRSSPGCDVTVGPCDCGQHFLAMIVFDQEPTQEQLASIALVGLIAANVPPDAGDYEAVMASLLSAASNVPCDLDGNPIDAIHDLLFAEVLGTDN